MEDPPMDADRQPPATPFAAGPMVLRRRRSSIVYLAFVAALLLGAAGVLVAEGEPWTAPLLVACAALVAGTGVARSRARTELAPDGVRNRTVRGEEFVAWSEIARAMPGGAGTVVLARRGGGMVRLAGLAGARARNEPSTEEILDLIRAQAGLHRPAGHDAEAAPPAVIERRLSLRPTLPLIGFLAIGGAVCAAFAATSGWPAVPSVFLFGLAALTTAASARARTVIGPDGIRNRALRKEVFIPWSDVADVTVSSTPPRTVRVVRRGGTTTTLAAVRDSDVPADGLGPDDIADVIRARAGVAEEGPPPLAEARPLTLRPSRRPLLWIVPLGAALATGWVLALGEVAMVAVSGYLLAFPAYFAVLSVVLLRGRTEAGTGGLRNRLLRTRELPWRNVEEFVVMPTLFGRVVQVVPTSGKRMTLAAPREGLLAGTSDLDGALATMRALAAAHRPDPPRRQNLSAAVMRTMWAVLLAAVLAMAATFWGPWLEPWWPGRHEATRLPAACSAPDTATVRRMLPGARQESADHTSFAYSARSDCRWTGDDGSLDVELDLRRRAAFSSGTDEARDEYAMTRRYVFVTRGARTAAVPGLGDEAWRWVRQVRRTSSVHLLARRANVIVEVRYSAERPADEATADAEALVRQVLARPRF